MFANLDTIISMNTPLLHALKALQHEHDKEVSEGYGGGEECCAINSSNTPPPSLPPLPSPLSKPILSVGSVFLEAFGKIDPQSYATFCSNQSNAANLYHEKKVRQVVLDHATRNTKQQQTPPTQPPSTPNRNRRSSTPA